MLLLEFDFEIKDKISYENVVANHMCRLRNENKKSCSPIIKVFHDGQLFQVKKTLPRFANIVNYIVGKHLRSNLNTQQMKRILHIVKSYHWNDELLYDVCIPDVGGNYHKL